MATGTSAPVSVLLLLFPFLFVSSAAPLPSSAGQVKTLCDATPNRTLCYQSLSALLPFAGSPIKLARAAVSLSLDSAKAVSTYLSEVPVDGGPLFECTLSMADCVDLLQQSVGEMDRLGRQAGSPQQGLSVGKVQTLAGKAITSANSCVGSLQRAQRGDGSVQDEAKVKEMATRTLQMASNALVFVKSIVP